MGELDNKGILVGMLEAWWSFKRIKLDSVRILDKLKSNTPVSWVVVLSCSSK